MYIQTPKRYRGTARRSMISCGRLVGLALLVALIAGGVFIYQNRDTIQPQIARIASGAMRSMEEQVATMTAPTPTPTTDPTVNLVNAENAWARGSISEALTYYQQAVPSQPNNVLVHQRVTLGLLTRGDVEQALDYAERTVTADPFSADAWATRSFAFSWEDDYEQGIVSALQALDIDPDHVAARAFLAYGYWGAGQTELANSRATQAIEADPNRFEGYWVRALIRENNLFDFEGARSDYESALSLAQEQSPPLVGVIAAGLARIQAIVDNDNEGAVATLNAALQSDPDNVTALYWLGWVHFSRRGDAGQAQTPLENCVDIDPENYECLYLLGRSFQRLENADAALELFLQAIDLGTPYARTYWWAANMEVVLGSCNNAAPLLETGYQMVAPGGLPAVDEGNTELLEAYVTLMNDCRVPIPGQFAPSPTPESTEEAAL